MYDPAQKRASAKTARQKSCSLAQWYIPYIMQSSKTTESKKSAMQKFSITK